MLDVIILRSGFSENRGRLVSDILTTFSRVQIVVQCVFLDLFFFESIIIFHPEYRVQCIPTLLSFPLLPCP